MINKKLMIILVTLLFSLPSHAVENIIGKITALEPTYMPGYISFQMDTGNSTCPAGRWFVWNKGQDNNKVVYATLMAALVSGKKINFIINDGDTTCTGAFLHLYQN